MQANNKTISIHKRPVNAGQLLKINTMKFIRKLFGLTPKVGDTVKGYLGYGVQYEGNVIEVRNDELMPGVIVDGVKTISTDWNGDITTNEPRIFVPISRVVIV